MMAHRLRAATCRRSCPGSPMTLTRARHSTLSTFKSDRRSESPEQPTSAAAPGVAMPPARKNLGHPGAGNTRLKPHGCRPCVQSQVPPFPSLGTCFPLPELAVTRSGMLLLSICSVGQAPRVQTSRMRLLSEYIVPGTHKAMPKREIAQIRAAA